MFYDPGYRGNVFRYNFWHHIGSGLSCGQAGIRLDDIICGVLIYGNVFYRCSHGGFGGVQMNGGRDNIVDNNLFVDCKYAVSFSPWPRERWQRPCKARNKRGGCTRQWRSRRPPIAPATRSWPGSTRIYRPTASGGTWPSAAGNSSATTAGSRIRWTTWRSAGIPASTAGKTRFSRPRRLGGLGLPRLPADPAGKSALRAWLRASWPVQRPQPRPVPVIRRRVP